MIAVLVPTLNEGKGIEEVLDAVPEEVSGKKTKIYIIDGGSTDGTVEKAEEKDAEIISQRMEGGKGEAVRQALREIDAEYYVMIDGDATYDPAEMEKLMAPILAGRAEHVIGRRKPVEKGALNRLNSLGNKAFNLMTRFLTGREVTDMLSGYRAFTKKSLERTSYSRPGFGIETEMTVSVLENNIPFEEVEVSYYRREGSSKLSPFRDGWRIAKTLAWTVRDLNPLKFFLLAAGVVLVIAIYPSFLTWEEKIVTGRVQSLGPIVFSAMLYILALQLVIFGMLADQMKNIEKRLRDSLPDES